jgi:hypothetical protein
MWRKRYRFTLDAIFEEYSSVGMMVAPDEAMDLMHDLLRDWVSRDASEASKATSRPATLVRFDSDAFSREAHHYAVDLFYKTYFPRGRGTPPLPDSYLNGILKLRREGLSHLAIANRLGIRRDTAKYQVAAAEKRWLEKVAQIDQLKRKYPQLVTEYRRVIGKKPAPGAAQSKGQAKPKGRAKRKGRRK